MIDDDEDDDLRARLRRVDPAHDLAPLDEGRTRAVAARAAATAAPGRHGVPRRRGVLVGAVLAVAAAAVVVTLVGGRDPAVTRLTAPAVDVSASCAVLTPELLAQHALAFRARVVAVEDGRVSLEVTHRFTGEVEDEVRVEQPADDLAELAPAQFEVGVDYLVTADAGTLSACGQTGPDSPELRALYEAAFG